MEIGLSLNIAGEVRSEFNMRNDKRTTAEMEVWLAHELTRYAPLQISHPHLAHIPTKEDDAIYSAIIARLKEADGLEVDVLRLLKERNAERAILSKLREWLENDTDIEIFNFNVLGKLYELEQEEK
jgi:hypothetical protein